MISDVYMNLDHNIQISSFWSLENQHHYSLASDEWMAQCLRYCNSLIWIQHKYFFQDIFEVDQHLRILTRRAQNNRTKIFRLEVENQPLHSLQVKLRKI